MILKCCEEGDTFLRFVIWDRLALRFFLFDVIMRDAPIMFGVFFSRFASFSSSSV